ncbi:MAG TPA: DNA-processing protein DprA [Gemmatimonadaceae bacterium]|nr:DNA-processing protein DprA [Gemmatimonadaceae bacterium]
MPEPTSISPSPDAGGGAPAPARERARALVIAAYDDRYPARLRELPDAPPLIWAVGALDTLAPPVVAIVGTRQSTRYGERVTRELAGAFARVGACVLSGLARGIDGSAHRAALEAGGRTAAVLGTGVNVAFPAGHRALQRHIGEAGLLLSELPPNAHAHKGSFIQRNRLIAALADLVIVVEAPERSGALSTARCALDMGRATAAVPGPIDVPQSHGTNHLIRDGAQIIATVADALALVGATPPVRSMIEPEDGDQLRLWRVLAEGPADLDALCTRTALPAQRCLAAVTALELRGSIECGLTGEIRRR